MIRTLRVFKTIFLLIISFSESRAEDVIETGIDGLVLKEFQCIMNSYSGNIVNRSNNLIRVRITVDSFDSDNDPIGRCTSANITLGRKSGNSIYITGCNCNGAKSFSVSYKTF